MIALQKKNAEHDCTGVLAALKTVKQCAESEIGGGSCDWSAWSAAYQQERDDLLECLKSL